MSAGRWLLALLLAVACSRGAGPGDEPPLETVDLPPAPALNPEADPRAQPREERLGGLLPNDFPSDLPLHLPATVIDFQDLEKGWVSVTLATSGKPAVVREGLAAELRARGWAAGDGRWRKGKREIALTVEPTPGGCHYRYVYRRW
ncbi:MAG: hypothetical protein D6696_16925 [Acidobacteria bacterium]|nr:MAG: hypothetical protein D6696_16925 [Acidobacteriota bacterium]